MYQLLDIGFIVFHTLIILFNLFGWIWEETRKWNLGLLLLTGSSWFILGIWYGWGYCPCTHWHWMVRRNLGYTDLPDSYIAFLIQQITGLSLPANLVDVATVSLFFLALLVSIFVNYRDFDKSRLLFNGSSPLPADNFVATISCRIYFIICCQYFSKSH